MISFIGVQCRALATREIVYEYFNWKRVIDHEVPWFKVCLSGLSTHHQRLWRGPAAVLPACFGVSQSNFQRRHACRREV